MALTATPGQREKMRTASATLGTGASKVRLWGMAGKLEYLGLTPDLELADIALSGVSRSVQRRAHNRSRWLGDTGGTGVAANTAQVKFFPSRRGTALPGEPVAIKNLETGDAVTIHLQGQIGDFIEYLTDNRLPFDAEIIGKSGNRYIAKLSETDPTAP